MRRPARTVTLIAAIAIFLSLSAESCEVKLTYGTQWQGDGSACNTVPADAVVQTIGGDAGGISQEFGKVTPTDYPGHPGCDRAFVLDYQMPTAGTNLNPGWDWAWIHVASRMEGLDQAKCGEMWTSLRVYAFWTYQGAAQEKLILETYRKATWNGFCDFGQPDNVFMSSAYARVRAVSQHGYGLAQTKSHYSYFVTNRFPL